MKDNDDILKRLKEKGNPFLVPDNYFEDFATNMMNNLPKDDQAPVMHINSYHNRFMVRIISAAACILLILGGAGLFFHRSSGSQKQFQVTSGQTVKSAETADNYIEQATDYAMMDNQDIYVCLSDE